MNIDTVASLVRRMPQLYYSAELADCAPFDTLPLGYAEAIRTKAGALADALTTRIMSAGLDEDDRAAAVAALETLRNCPRERARLNLAGKVFMSLRMGDAPDGDDPRDLLAHNLEAHHEYMHAELAAGHTLMRLLHTTAA